MKKKNHSQKASLIHAAKLRAAVLDILAKAPKSLPVKEIREHADIQAIGIGTTHRFDQIMWSMVRNKLVTRVGTLGHYEYAPITTNSPPVVVERAKYRSKMPTSDDGVFLIDIDERNNRVILGIGKLTISIGVKK